MPTYEYRCKKCGHEFEQFQSMTDEPLKKCSKCKGAVKRLISTGAGIIFKGSGFYETDYKGKGGKPDKDTSGNKKPDTCKKCDKCPSSKKED